MTWWLWILFWSIFWITAAVYLGWRTWRLWPHARAFGRACTQAMQSVDEARSQANRLANRERSTALVRSNGQDVDDLAWNTPASQWRERRRAQRARQRDLRLDDHTEVWASWRDPLDSNVNMHDA